MENATKTEQLKPGLWLSLGKFFKATFIDPTGSPDGNRITAFLACSMIFLYAIVSLFRTRLGLDEMPSEVLAVLAGLAGFTSYRASRETVEQIRVNPDVLTRE